MIYIDYKSALPIYEQIILRYKELIFEGVLKENEKISSVRELAAKLAINPNTIQKAYAELERNGYIYNVVGKGSYVSNDLTPLFSERRLEICGKAKSVVADAFKIGIDKKEIQNIIDKIYGEQHNG